MARKFNKLPSLVNVAAGTTATLSVPVGVTYHAINLSYSGVTPAQIKNIEVQINGKTIQEFVDGDRLNALNSYYNRKVEGGVLTLWFDRPEFDNVPLRRQTAIGTADVDTFQIKMDIDGAALDPSITAYAVVSQNSALGMITKIKRFVVTNSATGIKEISDIPKEGRIPAIFLFKGDISSMETSINSVKVYDMPKAIGEKVQRDYGRVPDSAAFTALDFHLEGDPIQSLIVQGVSDFRLRPNFDTAGSADLVVEYLTQFQGI